MPELIRIDPSARRAWQGERLLPLARVPFDLLSLLVSNAGRVVTREEIARKVWDADLEFADRRLATTVKNLRQVLRDNAQKPVYISTSHGVGYRFEEGAALPVPEQFSDSQETLRRVAEAVAVDTCDCVTVRVVRLLLDGAR